MSTSTSRVRELLRQYDRALAHTDELWRGLTPDEITWRPHEESSAIGRHLGHQAHVAHFVIRNLTAAEPSPDPELDGLMDSAHPERFRGALPTVERLARYRETVAERVRARIGAIATQRVAAPAQMDLVATHLLTALINHEYQHDQWIGEVRSRDLGHGLPEDPVDGAVCRPDGYPVLNPPMRGCPGATATTRLPPARTGLPGTGGTEHGSRAQPRRTLPPGIRFPGGRGGNRAGSASSSPNSV